MAEATRFEATKPAPDRILIVEDEENARIGYEALLRRWGYDVLGVASAEDALARFSDYAPAALIADVELSGMNGLDLLDRLGGFKRGEFFDQALDACLCDARGRKGFENCEYPQVAYLRAARETAAAVQAAEVVAAGHSGPAVGEELRRRRIERLAAWRNAKIAVNDP